jgi:alpha-N-acetylglucosamine transferase
MKGRTIVVCLLFLAIAAIPASAAENDKYGYITIQSVDISLNGSRADIRVDYTLDEPTRVIVLLLGKQDLKNRLLTVLNYDDAEVKNIDLNSAELVVDDVSYSYGRGVYWFPEHFFNVMVPDLRITTPQVIRNYSSVEGIPNGIGYFDTQAPAS